MMPFSRWWFRVACLFCLAASSAQAATTSFFAFPTLTSSMTDPIFKTLAADFAFRTVEPASDLGKRWGFYVGVSGTATDAYAVQGIFTGMSLPYVPSTDLQAGLGLPYGLTLEVGILPNMNLYQSTFGKYGGSLKWTLSRSVFPKLPFSLATTVSYTAAQLGFTQPLNGGTLTVAYNSSLIGGALVVSKSLAIIEPYLGVGILNHSSTLSATGTTTLFGGGFPAATSSVPASALTATYQAGLLLKLLVLGLAAEYNSTFGIPTYNFKATIRL